MGFKEFDQGIPGSRLEKWRQQEANEQLSREMQARWKESERIQGILRLAGSSPKATQVDAEKILSNSCSMACS
jgi:hypothetical protein